MAMSTGDVRIHLLEAFIAFRRMQDLLMVLPTNDIGTASMTALNRELAAVKLCAEGIFHNLSGEWRVRLVHALRLLKSYASPHEDSYILRLKLLHRLGSSLGELPLNDVPPATCSITAIRQDMGVLFEHLKELQAFLKHAILCYDRLGWGAPTACFSALAQTYFAQQAKRRAQKKGCWRKEQKAQAATRRRERHEDLGIASALHDLVVARGFAAVGQATCLLRHSLGVLRRRLGHVDADTLWYHAEVLSNVGDTYGREGLESAAQPLAQAALRIYEEGFRLWDRPYHAIGIAGRTKDILWMRFPRLRSLARHDLPRTDDTREAVIACEKMTTLYRSILDLTIATGSILNPAGTYGKTPSWLHLELQDACLQASAFRRAIGDGTSARTHLINALALGEPPSSDDRYFRHVLEGTCRLLTALFTLHRQEKWENSELEEQRCCEAIVHLFGRMLQQWGDARVVTCFATTMADLGLEPEEKIRWYKSLSVEMQVKTGELLEEALTRARP